VFWASSRAALRGSVWTPISYTFAYMAPESPTLLAAEEMMNLMLARATGGDAPPAEYKRCRTVLTRDQTIANRLPRFVRTCHDPDAFWAFIKAEASGDGSYDRRRQLLRDAFRPLLDHLEDADRSPLDADVGDATVALDAESAIAAWSKAIARRTSDPEGAITAARSLLESVCKTILDDRGVAYDDRKDDLPKLYGRVAKALRLAPSDHTEEQFRAILGGCTSVVNGLGSIRNRTSDAHGQGRTVYKPAERHAALAVNLAGAMSLFLIETHEAREPRLS
jgi:Abortive infection C-terminus